MGFRPGPGLFTAAWRARALQLGEVPLAAAAVLVVAVSILWLTLPDPLPLASRWPETTAYIELRREQARRAGEELDLRWEPVPLERVSEPVQRAVRVAEDASFYRHGGIDWHEVRASLREWWRDEERPRGASTITMQLARNLYLSPERSFWRKLRETLLALRLEARLSKRRILELYLGTVELGPGVFGVEAAARHYWGLPASALDRRRAAEVAATLPAPLRDNPRTRTRRFRWRADLIRERAFGSEPVRPDTPSADTTPDGRPSADSVAADSVPADSVPADLSPADPVAADTIPGDRGPADTLPADPVPPDTARSRWHRDGRGR